MNRVALQILSKIDHKSTFKLHTEGINIRFNRIKFHKESFCEAHTKLKTVIFLLFQRLLQQLSVYNLLNNSIFPIK